MSGNDKEKVTLAKALRIKNRLAKAIKGLESEIIYQNSLPKGETRKVDVREAAKAHSRAGEILVEVKEAIAEANRPVRGKVFELAELKSRLSMWGEVSADEGKTLGGRLTKLPDGVEMESEFSYEEIKRIQEDLTRGIDTLQEELDRFNHTVEVEVDSGYRSFHRGDINLGKGWKSELASLWLAKKLLDID